MAAPTRRTPTLESVRAHRAEIGALAERYGVTDIRVFGSVARGDADERSDLDLLVAVHPDRGLLALSAFAGEVEDLLQVPTQVATVNGLKARGRQQVTAEAVPV